jgi:hypothetical protein
MIFITANPSKIKHKQKLRNMKKHFLSMSAIVLTATTLVFTGCKKDDTTAPVVTLNGAETVTLILNTPYTELGATATDDEDGSITPTITGTVNKDLAGTYTLTYSATDAAGNVGEATRTVIVRNEADIYAGTYSCTNPDFGSASPWTQTVTASPTKNNRIVFSKFAARTGNSTITADLIGGTAFQINDATVTPVSGGCTFKYTANGTGAAITKINGKYTFSVKYFEERLAGGGSCTAVAATPFEDKFDQQ